MEGGGVIGSGALMMKMENMKHPRNIESYGSFGQVMGGLVYRIQRNILIALGHQETWIPQGVILYHIHKCSNEK